MPPGSAHGGPDERYPDCLPARRPCYLPQRQTMSFNLPSRRVADPRRLERRLVEQVGSTQPGT